MFYDRFIELCVKYNISPSAAAEAMGMKGAHVTRWKNGSIPTDATMQKIATFFKVPISYFTGTKNKAPSVQADEANDATLYKFPVIGKIAAGYDGEAVEEYTGDFDYYPINQVHGDPRQYMVLRIKGDSMYPKLLDGDMVLVRRCASVDSGKIAAIMYNGDEATVKKVNYVYGEDWLELIPINPEYMTKRIEGADLEQCRVLGEVISMHRRIG